MSWILLNFWCNLQVVTTNECFNDLVCIPSGYKRHIRPPPKNGTTNIKVEFEKIQILNIDENEGTITIKFSLASVWSDPRIFVSPNATDEDKKRITTTRKTGYLELIDLPRYFKNRLWLPNPYIANAHKINKYKVHDDFDVLYYGLYGNMTRLSHRIELETIIFCKMNFDSYPMDKHSCYFTLGSYAFLKQSGQHFTLADYKTRASIQFNNSDQVAQLDFEIIDVKELPKGMKNCWDNYGMSQRTGFEIKFQRKFQRYIDAYYFPSGILVVLSWVSNFLLPTMDLGLIKSSIFSCLISIKVKISLMYEFFAKDWLCYSTRSNSWQNGFANNSLLNGNHYHNGNNFKVTKI